jgi:hypothetical protein
LAGMCVFLHLRLLSSTILSAKQYTKKSAPSLQRDRPVFLLQKRYRQKNIFYYQSENDSLTCNFVIYNKGALERL